MLAYAFAFQGVRGVWDPDEGRYCAAALEMIRTGDYIHIQLPTGHPHYTKPPCTYWLLAASMKYLGANEFAARLPNSLVFWGTCLLLWGLGRRFTPTQEWLPAIVYASSVLTVVAAHIITTDTILAFFEVLAVFAFLSCRTAKGRLQQHLFVWLMWAAFGAAFLTKGPPGLLPLLPILVFSCIADGLKRTLLRVAHPGILAFLVIGFGWFIVIIRSDPFLLNYFIQREVVARVASGVHNRNPEWYAGFIIYAPTLLVGCLPWVKPFLTGLARAPRFCRWDRWREISRTDPIGLFLILWFLLPMAVLFFSRSRMFLYVVPFYAPVALLMAKAMEQRSHTWGRRIGLLIVIWCCFVSTWRIASARVLDDKNTRYFAQTIQERVNFPFHEIVFVDTQPRYALNFYLHTEIERVSLREVYPSKREGGYESLLAELQEPDGADMSIYILKEEHSTEFERAAVKYGYSPILLGQWDEFRVYSLRPTGGAAPL
ncbi:MAG: glycosyltransferase family 39 protein [Planctomycetota bacterium]